MIRFWMLVYYFHFFNLLSPLFNFKIYTLAHYNQTIVITPLQFNHCSFPF